MRRKLVAGNWKMNGTLESMAEVTAIAAAAEKHSAVEVALALPATLIASSMAHAGCVAIGAQDVYAGAGGAHTGCLAAAMLRDAGAVFTIVGHSERRTDQHETDADVRAKAEAARDAGLRVIMCVGETLAERDAGTAVAVVTGQLAASLPTGAGGDWLSVAYEPIWAIGTGRTPEICDVVEMHGAIRDRLAQILGDGAAAIRILYGGSVTADNANALLHADDVDGALVGGASLTAAKFAPIIAAADG